MATATKRRSELLMPAGNLEKLRAAILYGADAVYLGTPDMSLRTKSEFTLEEVVEGIEYAHSMGKRVYLTLNLFSHNKDIDKLPQFVETVRQWQQLQLERVQTGKQKIAERIETETASLASRYRELERSLRMQQKRVALLAAQVSI